MPYDVDNPPEKLRGLPENKQRQWVHVHESCMAKYNDDVKCQKMSWGTTHGWKEKGFSPDDPDRDILIEMEVAELMENEDKGFPETISEKQIKDLLLSNAVGLEVEAEE